MSGARRAVFLDRDGVLNEAVVRAGKPYPPASVEALVVAPGASEALASLAAAGYLLIGATNQPDVARGTRSREAVEEINARLLAELPLSEILVSYEDGEGSYRRKPNPGLLLEAAEKYDIDLAGSFMVGDRWKDVEAGRRAGCGTAFLDYGYDEPKPDPPADFTGKSLAAAAHWILSLTPPGRGVGPEPGHAGPPPGVPYPPR